MPPCFPLPFHAARRRRQLLSFFKFRSLARCHVEECNGATASADLNSHQVIILETWPSSKELRRHLMVSPPRKDCKVSGEEVMEKRVEERGRVEESEEEFFSVKSCLSRCSGSGSEECWWEERGWQCGKTTVGLPEEWFWECKGWPFGLWRQRLKMAMMPPPLKSPSDSWSWHKKNLSNGKVWPVWPASVNLALG